MQASRERYWSELTSDEKIEKLREHVRSLSAALVQADKKLAALSAHGHADGEIMVPLGSPNHEPMGSVLSLPYRLRKGLPEDMA